MTTSEARKFYFAKIDKNSRDGELAQSFCVSCKGKGCQDCDDVGRKAFCFEVEGQHYAMPLWVLDKEGIHSFLKGVSPVYPVDKEGKPLSLGNSRSAATDDQVRDFLDWIYLEATYSGISLDNWADARGV